MYLGPGIPKGEFATWNHQPLGIPATSPSILHNSRVIGVSYYLKVEVDVPWGFDPTVSMNIIMGTVPFRATYGQPQQYGLPQEQVEQPATSRSFLINLFFISSSKSIKLCRSHF